MYTNHNLWEKSGILIFVDFTMARWNDKHLFTVFQMFRSTTVKTRKHSNSRCLLFTLNNKMSLLILQFALEKNGWIKKFHVKQKKDFFLNSKQLKKIVKEFITCQKIKFIFAIWCLNIWNSNLAGFIVLHQVTIIWVFKN